MPSKFRERAPRALIAFVRSAPLLVAPVVHAQTLPTPASLDPVVVTANRTPQPLSSVLGDLSVIDRDAIGRAGVSGVADLLARLPGVEFARSGGLAGTTSVFIRGGETRHTAVFLDGVRIDSQSTGGAVWEQIPLDRIERIEVLRGPAAAVYGSDAIAGVVQLFTKRGDGAPRPTAAVTLGSYRTVQAQLGVSGSTGGLDYAVSAAHGRSAGFDARTDLAAGHDPDADGWKRSSIDGRVGYQIDTVHRVDASLLASNLSARYDAGGAGVDDLSQHALRTGRVAWQARWNERASTRVQVGETRSNYETDPSYYRTETTLRDLTLQHEQRLGPNLLTATFDRREDGLLNPATPFSVELSGKRHQDGIGVGWRGDFGDHGLQAHLRRDQDSEFQGKTTGSLAWGWSFLPGWRLTASGATSFRAPTLYQRFSEYGNPSLTPESGRNLELGLRWSPAGSELSLTGWRNRVTNLISFGSPGICASTFGCYQNVGRAQLEGVTLAGRTQLAGVALHGSIDWHDPRNTDTDRLLQRRARRLASFGADTLLAGWTFGTEVQAAGLRYENAANTQPLGGYALVNFYLARALAPGLMLEARLDNATDKQYELARAYATAGRSGQVTLRWTGL